MQWAQTQQASDTNWGSGMRVVGREALGAASKKGLLNTHTPTTCELAIDNRFTAMITFSSQWSPNVS